MNRKFTKYREDFRVYIRLLAPPPPRPTPIEPGGTYVHSPSPEPPPPPPSRVFGYHWQLQKHPLFRVFSGNLPETTAKICPLSRENGNMHAASLCIRVGGGGGASCMTYEIITHTYVLLSRTYDLLTRTYEIVAGGKIYPCPLWVFVRDCYESLQNIPSRNL